MLKIVIRPFFAAGRMAAHHIAPVTLGALLLSTTAMAETLYVTDILRLGLHASSDTSDQPFRTLVSGDELEILRRTTYYAQVRTTDGAEGWVKASYLTDEKPAQARLAELTRERNRLDNAVTTLSSRLAEQDSELDSLRADRQSLKQDADAAAIEVATLRTDNESLGKKVAAYKFSVPFLWMFGIAALMLVGGFLGGWWYADAKQRKRHGGFRI